MTCANLSLTQFMHSCSLELYFAQAVVCPETKQIFHGRKFLQGGTKATISSIGIERQEKQVFGDDEGIIREGHTPQHPIYIHVYRCIYKYINKYIYIYIYVYKNI